MKNENLFINIWEYDRDDVAFQWHIAGRGTGKTYSALKGVAIDKIHQTTETDKFIFMRRTDKELNLIMDNTSGKEGANPLKAINNDYDTNYGFYKIVDGVAGCYRRELDENGRYKHIGEPIGYAVALSTICSIRGIDFSDVTVIIYDEFIPEKHVRKMASESDALLNAYESINRNRELFGKPPVKFIGLANSNDIYNPIFTGLDMVRDCERMIRQGKEHKLIVERSMYIHIYKTLETFAEEKGKTALHKLAKGTQFQKMALQNDFAYNDFSDIAHRDLRGYLIICALDNGYIYKKKGANEFYMTYAPSKCPRYKTDNSADRRAFLRSVGSSLQDAVTLHLFTYESYELKTKLLDIYFS